MWQMLWLDPVPTVELDFAGWPAMLAVVGMSLVAFVAVLVSRSPRRRARVAAGRAAAVVRAVPLEIIPPDRAALRALAEGSARSNAA